MLPNAPVERKTGAFLCSGSKGGSRSVHVPIANFAIIRDSRSSYPVERERTGVENVSYV
jgi:hypothetical protein